MKKRYEINMTKGPLLPELLQFILPLMLSSMLQIAFNAADLIVVGRFGRPHSKAAVGANGAMINLIINVLMGLATGGGVLCARYYGANQTDKLHRTVSTTLITGVIGGVITGALGLALTVPLLRLVGSPDEVLPLATVYLRIYFLGLPVMALYNFSAAALRALAPEERIDPSLLAGLDAAPEDALTREELKTALDTLFDPGTVEPVLEALPESESEYVTRAEFAFCVSQLLGKESAAEDVYYPDVAPTHWASAEVLAAAGSGTRTVAFEPCRGDVVGAKTAETVITLAANS